MVGRSRVKESQKIQPDKASGREEEKGYALRKPTYEEALALIRQRVPDVEVARRTGYSRERIRQLRVRMGILFPPGFRYYRHLLPYLRNRKFLTKLKKLLKDPHCYSDRQIARFLQVPLSLIIYLRKKKFRIPSHSKRRLALLKPFLGKATDAQVAARFGYNVSTVMAHRKQLNIPSYRSTHQRLPSHLNLQAFQEALKNHPSSVVARQFGVSLRVAYYYRTKWGIRRTPLTLKLLSQESFRQVLGKQPDGVVAHRYGISASTVARCREALGIPPYLPPRRKIRK